MRTVWELARGYADRDYIVYEDERYTYAEADAVIRALEEAKSTLIHDHIEHCLEDAIGPTTRDQRATIEGFKKISRYL